MKILVIEDEKAMLETIVRSLEEEKYVVESALDFDTAILSGRSPRAKLLPAGESDQPFGS